MLGNPYNFALNTSAAEYVFNHCDKLAGLTLIPTDTTTEVKWNFQDLAKLSPAVSVRSLSFHGKIEPWELISTKERDGASHTTEEFLSWRSERASNTHCNAPSQVHNVVMADLTAILASFTQVFDPPGPQDELVRQSSVRVSIKKPIQGSDQMILQMDEKSKIEYLMFEISEGEEAVVAKDARAVFERALKTFLCAAR
ncbi:hypothetical protein LA080_008061 [Diaporthe eres]|nr:hypothetical protein LA080_008061 [Diaporthe eres]